MVKVFFIFTGSGSIYLGSISLTVSWRGFKSDSDKMEPKIPLLKLSLADFEYFLNIVISQANIFFVKLWLKRIIVMISSGR